MVTNYEELNMLYSLLSSVATKVNEHEVAQVIVRHARDTLNCRRVSLLVLDEDGKHLRVLAASGVPDYARHVTIPIARSVAGKVVAEGCPLISGQMQDYPDLAALSRGTYDSDTFAVIRVPMQARGRPVGVLTATERDHGEEFTARDHKLLESLSAMGAASLMNCRLHATVNRQMMSTIRALACAVDAKDRYTHAHSDRVAQLAVATARQLGIADNEAIRKVELVGLLHDIGKIGIPDAILAKPGRLTPEEFAIIKTHASIGGRIVREVNGLEDVAEAIEHHHERYDGLGYPSALPNADIPLTAKIVAVADTFDSLISNRSYRKGTDTESALQEIARCQGTQFDPAVVEAFRAALAARPELAVPASDSRLETPEALACGTET
jgi:putative nucleotidyltransferase with HDIG domain